MKSSVALALSIFAAAACAHKEPVQHTTVSAVGNEDMTDNESHPDNQKMQYTEVSNRDALNHDAERREHEEQSGGLEAQGSGKATDQGQASAENAKCDMNVYFATASSELTQRAKDQLNSIAQCLKKRNVEDALIVGSADPRGSEKENAELGKERARKVAAYLKELGLSEDEIRIRSVGESQASAQPNTWPAARRAEIQNK